MDAQAVIAGAKLERVREMRAEIERLRAENLALRSENDTLRAHFDLALLAAKDFECLPEGGRFLVVDGWNVLLSDGRNPRAMASAGTSQTEGLEAFWTTRPTREALIEGAREHLAAHPGDFAWIVFDGAREGSFCEGRLRVSYTGGSGPQRADRFICDFLRMARFRGGAARVTVVTLDRKLLKEAKRLTA